MKKNQKILEIISNLEKLLENNGEGTCLLKELKDLLSDRSASQNKVISNKKHEDNGVHIPKELEGQSKYYALFSDGACRGNPGPGSWASCGILPSGEFIFEKTGIEMSTTNNRMELEGAINALLEVINFHNTGEIIKEPVYLFTDSTYVVNGVTKWVSGWKSRGWKKSDGRPPLNIELWKQLDELSESFAKLFFKWVRGHAGHYYNEKCDQMANQALDEAGL